MSTIRGCLVRLQCSPLHWWLCSESLLNAGSSLESICYNMGCKTECECLKSDRIGWSAAKFQGIDNTKSMWYNTYGKSSTTTV